MKNQHSFAKPWLHRLGHEITINGKNFFLNDITELHAQYDQQIKPLKTEIILGNEFMDEEELKEQIPISYTDLMKKFGWAVLVVDRPADKGLAWHKGQRSLLYLAKMKKGSTPLSREAFNKKGLVVMWDRVNRAFQGIGEDFGTKEGKYGLGNVTPWVQYEKDETKKTLHGKVIVKPDYDNIADDWISEWEGVRKEKKKVLQIKEIPVMITVEGSLLCLPYDKDYAWKIVGVGETGGGKSFLLNSYLGREFLINGSKCGILNDSLNQFYDLMLPMDQNPHILTLSRIGNEPRCLPVINLYMSCPNLKMRYEDEDISYRLVVSFKDFLRRYSFFKYGVARWDLKGSERYLTQEVIDQLHRCKTVKEVEEKLYEVLPHGKKEDDGFKKMITKIIATIENIFRDQFTSNLFLNDPRVAPYWHLKRKDGLEFTNHPFIVAAYGGLFPIINNSKAKTREIAKKQLADLIRRIVDFQMELDEKKKRIYIGIDELKDLLGEKGDDLYEALDYLFTQGRFPDIGFVGSLQEYTRMSNSMQNNTSHLVVFDLRKDSERKAIAKDYRLDVTRLEEMAELGQHECLLITKKRIVIYDKEGRRKEKKEGESGLWKGKIVPPISVHRKPSDRPT